MGLLSNEWKVANEEILCRWCKSSKDAEREMKAHGEMNASCSFPMQWRITVLQAIQNRWSALRRHHPPPQFPVWWQAERGRRRGSTRCEQWSPAAPGLTGSPGRGDQEDGSQLLPRYPSKLNTSRSCSWRLWSLSFSVFFPSLEFVV